MEIHTKTFQEPNGIAEGVQVNMAHIVYAFEIVSS